MTTTTTTTTLYLLDTNAASAAMRGHPAVDARLQALPPDQWCISAVTCSEIRYGVARRAEAVQLHRLVQAFLRVATILPWDADAANRHGALRAQLKAQGTPIGDFDEMIAAHALALSAMCPPWGAVLCHETAHILNSEAAATSMMGGGPFLRCIGGDDRRIQPATLASCSSPSSASR